MGNKCWCVDFSLNGELQDAVDFFDTEEDAIEYCLKEANMTVEDCRGRRYHPPILHRKEKCTVEVRFFDDEYVWHYSPYNIRKELEKLGINWEQYSFLN